MEKWEDRKGTQKQVTKVIGLKLIMLGPSKGKKDEDAESHPDDVPF
jgi:single-stranded DNA-binding protein